jgi:ubiquitin C-terminal hydrolase
VGAVVSCLQPQTDDSPRSFLRFPVDLELPSAYLSHEAKAQNRGGPVQYSLRSVVFHVGPHSQGGHYTVVSGDGVRVWRKFDDTDVQVLSQSSPTVPREREVPYILFYERQDELKCRQ